MTVIYKQILYNYLISIFHDDTFNTHFLHFTSEHFIIGPVYFLHPHYIEQGKANSTLNMLIGFSATLGVEMWEL